MEQTLEIKYSFTMTYTAVMDFDDFKSLKFVKRLPAELQLEMWENVIVYHQGEIDIDATMDDVVDKEKDLKELLDIDEVMEALEEPVEAEVEKRKKMGK